MSDTHRLRLVANPFLTFQHVTDVVDRRLSSHNIAMNIGTDSIRIPLWRRRRFSGCTKYKHYTADSIVAEITDLA